MYPEDRVLVGVIKRKRDFDTLQREHWYRIPHKRAPQGIDAEYIAFFMSRAFKAQNGGIHYYARRTGMELVRRRDLVPGEAEHPRADDWYHKLQIGELRPKEPPVLNSDRRAVSFIHTTWDRFEVARTIADLYSDADEFVDRVFHALQRSGVPAERQWEAARTSDDGGAQVRVRCEDGDVIASTRPDREHRIALPSAGDQALVTTSVQAILDAIRAHGGPVMINIPLEE